jgi:hypothetical protein
MIQVSQTRVPEFEDDPRVLEFKDGLELFHDSKTASRALE